MSQIVYDSKSKGAKTFSGKLQNISDPDNITDLSLDNVAKYTVYFTTPKGEILARNAVLPGPNESTSDDMDITFVTTPDDPVITETGLWQYTVGVTFANNVTIVSPHTISFWVV